MQVPLRCQTAEIWRLIRGIICPHSGTAAEFGERDVIRVSKSGLAANAADDFLDRRIAVQDGEQAVILFTDLAAESPGQGEILEGLASANTYLGNLHLHAGRFPEATPCYRQALAFREKGDREDWSLFRTQAFLGACLAGEGRYAEAEPLLLGG